MLFSEYIWDKKLYLSANDTNFLCKYLAHHIYKPIPIKEKFQKVKTRFFLALKVLLFCLLSVP